MAAASSVLEVAALLAIWLIYMRGPATRERLLTASAAAVCAFVAFNKVLSPQYVIWLVPLVPLVSLVRGRRGPIAIGLLAAAMVLTQTWFPYRYWHLVYTLDPTLTWLVLARDLALVGLLAVLAWPDVPLRALLPRRRLRPAG